MKIENPEFEAVTIPEGGRNHEKDVAQYYEDQGYNVVDSPQGHRTLNTGLEPIRTIKEEAENDLEDIFCSGVPDLLVYNYQEYFFVECKNAHGLRIGQIKWFVRNQDLPAKIVWVQ